MEKEERTDGDDWKLSVKEIMEKACTINGN